MIAGGLLISAFFYWVIAFVGYMEVNSPWIFLGLWVVQGFAQSPVYPGCVALLGKWFSQSSRGKIMGFFSSSSSAGNAFAAATIAVVLAAGGSWQVSMISFSIIEFIIGIGFLYFVKEKYSEGTDEILMVSLNEEVQLEQEEKKKHGIPFIQALLLPNLINFAVCVACMKFMNYALSMWIPFFLSEQGQSGKVVGIMTSMLELGSLFGTITCGWLGDKIKTRPPVISLFIFLAFPAVAALALIDKKDAWVYFIVIPIAGFCAGGPNFILSSAVPVDIAQNSQINHLEAMATVAGIIDGSGGVGAGIGMLIIGKLASKGWGYVFSFMLTTGCMAFIALYRISRKEFRKFLARRRVSQSN